MNVCYTIEFCSDFCADLFPKHLDHEWSMPNLFVPTSSLVFHYHIVSKKGPVCCTCTPYIRLKLGWADIRSRDISVNNERS